MFQRVLVGRSAHISLEEGDGRFDDRDVNGIAIHGDKMYSWSDCEGDLDSVFSKEELLTNVCIYWFTRTIASSSRLYLETLRHPWLLPEGTRIEAPTAISAFPRELSVPPRRWAERIYNVTRWTPMPRGGHFAAAEQPDALVQDIRASFAGFRL
jgi:pimeloyl-ACP methyl ester carboxylesterase